jgi:hypothetical protein
MSERVGRGFGHFDRIEPMIVAGGDRPPPRIEGERICEEDGCDTLLSAYNLGSDRCSIHFRMSTGHVRGRAVGTR